MKIFKSLNKLNKQGYNGSLDYNIMPPSHGPNSTVQGILFIFWNIHIY